MKCPTPAIWIQVLEGYSLSLHPTCGSLMLCCDFYFCVFYRDPNDVTCNLGAEPQKKMVAVCVYWAPTSHHKSLNKQSSGPRLETLFSYEQAGRDFPLSRHNSRQADCKTASKYQTCSWDLTSGYAFLLPVVATTVPTRGLFWTNKQENLFDT